MEQTAAEATEAAEEPGLKKHLNTHKTMIYGHS